MKPAETVHDMCQLYTPNLLDQTVSVRWATCLQTDDTNNNGTAYFLKMEEELGAHFERKPTMKLNEGSTIDFNGCNIRLNNGIYSISQQFHIYQLTEVRLSKTIDNSMFSGQRARGAYITSIGRPDLTSGLALLAQCKTPTEHEIIKPNNLIKKANQRKSNYNFARLDTDTLRLLVFTDASFAQNKYLTSKLGYFIVMADSEGNGNLLHYSIFK